MPGPLTQQRIDTLYIFLVVDPNGDDIGILESRNCGEHEAFIFTSFEEAAKKYPAAEQLCRKLKQSFRVVKFRGFEDCTHTIEV